MLGLSKRVARGATAAGGSALAHACSVGAPSGPPAEPLRARWVLEAATRFRLRSAQARLAPPRVGAFTAVKAAPRLPPTGRAAMKLGGGGAPAHAGRQATSLRPK
eukprot:10463845-Alexandrium_andersonii.AAC.1